MNAILSFPTPHSLTAPRSTVSLATSSLVVTVEVNVWTATKQDRSVANEITTQKNASADAAKVTKMLLSHSAEHKALMNYRQTVSNWLRRITYDWSGAARLLPVYLLEQFNREFTQHETEYTRLVDAFLAAYPSLISDAAFKQGTMFNRNEYPSVDDVRSRFRIRKFVHEVPQTDFRCSISEVIAEDLRNHYEAQSQAIITNLMQDMTERMVTCVTRLRNACDEVASEVEQESKAGGTGKAKRRKVYESTYDSVREMVDMLRNFNLTNDPALRAAAEKLDAAVETFSLLDLRESAFARAQVRDDLNDVLSAFAPLSSFVSTESTESDNDNDNI